MAFAIIFNDVGVGEWFVLLAVVLIVVGPKRLPETARKFGQYYAKFRRAAESFKRQILEMDTEFTRAVDNAERDIDNALSTDDGTSQNPADPNAAPDPEHSTPGDYGDPYSGDPYGRYAAGYGADAPDATASAPSGPDGSVTPDEPPAEVAKSEPPKSEPPKKAMEDPAAIKITCS